MLFPPWRIAPSWPEPSHYRTFTVILRHTTVARTPLEEWSVRYSNFYYTTQNTHNRQISLAPTGIEFATPASERRQTNALDCEGKNKKVYLTKFW